MARRSAETPRLPSQGSGPGSIAVVRDALWLAEIPGDQVGPCPVDGTGCHPPHSQRWLRSSVRVPGAPAASACVLCSLKAVTS